MRTDYFAIMSQQAEYSVKAAELLERILKEYQPSKTSAWRDEMHHIEQAADEVRHDALKQLAREFITPIERDDLLRLIQILDDVTDAIDEVVIELYMFNVARLPLKVHELSDVMVRCVRSLNAAVREFPQYKKSEKLPPLLIEVNTMESEADAAYIEAVRALFVTEKEPMRAFGVKAIYDCLEECCDLCEHAADVIESTVMNNT